MYFDLRCLLAGTIPSSPLCVLEAITNNPSNVEVYILLLKDFIVMNSFCLSINFRLVIYKITLHIKDMAQSYIGEPVPLTPVTCYFCYSIPCYCCILMYIGVYLIQEKAIIIDPGEFLPMI